MFLVLKLAEKLGLTDEQTIRVAGQFRAAQEKRLKLVEERSTLDRSLERELAKQPADEKALSSLTARALEIDRSLALLPDETFSEIGKQLSGEQRARLALLKGELREQVRNEQIRRGLARRGGVSPEEGPGPGASPGARPRRWWRGF
jgi:hypothetical protein